jgi:hypothetical protein
MNSDFIKSLFARRRPRPKPAMVPVGRALLTELESMEPGQIMNIMDVDGREFAVIATDDLRHIAERAGMRLKGDL